MLIKTALIFTPAAADLTKALSNLLLKQLSASISVEQIHIGLLSQSISNLPSTSSSVVDGTPGRDATARVDYSPREYLVHGRICETSLASISTISACCCSAVLSSCVSAIGSKLSVFNTSMFTKSTTSVFPQSSHTRLSSSQDLVTLTWIYRRLNEMRLARVGLGIIGLRWRKSAG